MFLLPHPHVSPSFLTGLNSPHFILLASSSPQFIVGRRPSSTRAYIYIIYRAAAILKSSLDIGTVYHIIRCKDMGFEFFQQIFYTFFSIHCPFYKKKLKISGKRTIRRAKRSKKMLRNKKYGALKHLQSAYAHVKMVLLTELWTMSVGLSFKIRTFAVSNDSLYI